MATLENKTITDNDWHDALTTEGYIVALHRGFYARGNTKPDNNITGTKFNRGDEVYYRNQVLWLKKAEDELTYTTHLDN
jgi:hypothetical protein